MRSIQTVVKPYLGLVWDGGGIEGGILEVYQYRDLEPSLPRPKGTIRGF